MWCCRRRRRPAPTKLSFQPFQLRSFAAGFVGTDEPDAAWTSALRIAYISLQQEFHRDEFPLRQVLERMTAEKLTPPDTNHFYIHFVLFDQMFGRFFSFQQLDDKFPVDDVTEFVEPFNPKHQAVHIEQFNDHSESFDCTEALRSFSWNGFQVGGPFRPHAFQWLCPLQDPPTTVVATMGDGTRIILEGFPDGVKRHEISPGPTPLSPSIM